MAISNKKRRFLAFSLLHFFTTALFLMLIAPVREEQKMYANWPIKKEEPKRS